MWEMQGANSEACPRSWEEKRRTTGVGGSGMGLGAGKTWKRAGRWGGVGTFHSGTPSTAKARGLEFTSYAGTVSGPVGGTTGLGHTGGYRPDLGEPSKSGLGVPSVTFCKATVIKSR